MSDCHFGVSPVNYPDPDPHLSTEDMLKSEVIEEKNFKHNLWTGADNPLGPNF